MSGEAFLGILSAILAGYFILRNKLFGSVLYIDFYIRDRKILTLSYNIKDLVNSEKSERKSLSYKDITLDLSYRVRGISLKKIKFDLIITLTYAGIPLPITLTRYIDFTSTNTAKIDILSNRAYCILRLE